MIALTFELAPFKRALLWIAGVAAAAAVVLAIALVGASIERSISGADPESVLTDPWASSRQRATAVTWLPDETVLARSVEPSTRAAVARSWIDTVDHPADSREDVFTAHRAAVWFSSLDGQVLGLTIETERIADLDRDPVWLSEHYEIVAVLRDGDWRFERVRRSLRDS